MASPSDKRRPARTPSRGPRRTAATSTRPARASIPRRPDPVVATRSRPTSRAVILVLVLAVLAVSYASSLRAYLQQRAHITDLQSTIDEREQQIDVLEREKRRWSDDEYIRAQARERLGYVKPGETPFVVLEDGRPLQTSSALSEPRTEPSVDEAWWDKAWATMEVAGKPPRKATPLPETKVADPEGAPRD
ncbi:septum formation initiator family protein [Nocardioides sp. R-C-SC26]|uniref:FtsB family cell division protein n=1 Tax=Nocardioides sp. R-C-SC26 TaxID=2870414 RepID=UPI001E426667|nr:septum formation initiator family protein [Nocardioides sp. R-C-SC26]